MWANTPHEGKIIHPFKLLVAISTSIVIAITPMSALAQGKKKGKPLTSEATMELCKDKLSDWDIKRLNIGDTHEFKRDFIGRDASTARYELCKCKDGRVVIRQHSCKGGQIETGYKLP